tara:strand:- start:799 stop:1326 length:528 start_codon:yes stop_codon:yes gene_type:complete
MLNNLIIYSSTDGQTLNICNKISEVISVNDDTTIISLEEAEGTDISLFKKIIIGASIRYGKHKPNLYKFIDKNSAELSAKKSAFFSVNVVARKPEKNTPDTNPYMQKFLSLSTWKPSYLEVFAGKIDYPKYKFIDKHMIRFIMWMTKGPTDLKGTYEFTNWDSVDNFANKIGSID